MSRNSTKSVPTQSRTSAAVHRRTTLRPDRSRAVASSCRGRAGFLSGRRQHLPRVVEITHGGTSRGYAGAWGCGCNPYAATRSTSVSSREMRAVHWTARRNLSVSATSSIRSLGRIRRASCSTCDRPAEDAAQHLHDVRDGVGGARAHVEHVHAARAAGNAERSPPRYRACRCSRGAARRSPAG